MLACEFCETFINTFFSRAPPVAPSVESFLKWFLNPGATSCVIKFCFVKWSIFKKYDFLKKLQVKVRSTSKHMSVFVFYLWSHLWQTFMLIERWKSTIKKIYAEVFLFETTVSKFWGVDSPWWHHQPKNVSYKIFLVTIFLSLSSPHYIHHAEYVYKW